MELFFDSIYGWFSGFFGHELQQYLWGQASPFATTDMFVTIGWIMIVISAVFMVLYYYLINHPKLNTWWGWLLFLVCNAIVNFLVGWQWLRSDHSNGKMVNFNNDPLSGIGEENFLCFGFSNAILSILFFVILSFIFRRWSRNCSNAPFVIPNLIIFK